MPDWEIKEWNENNYDVHCCEYVEQAYAAKNGRLFQIMQGLTF